MGYGARYRSRPECYGKGYNDKDPECVRECPFREACYDRMDWDEDDDESPSARRRRRREKERTGRRRTSSDRSRNDLPYPPDELLDELLYVEDGEPWHSRLGWNALSGGLSAIGGEVQEFFRVFRFQPRARRALPPVEESRPRELSDGCGHKRCGGEAEFCSAPSTSRK